MSTEQTTITTATPAATPTKPSAKAKAKAAAKSAGKKPAKAARKKLAKAPAKPARTLRDGTKGAKLLDLLRRKQGATIPELAKAARWLPHTTRAFISRLPKNAGVKVVSEKREGEERTYRIA